MDRIFEPPAFPVSGDYRVLYADPPWAFETYSRKGQGKSPSQHYETMTLKDLCAMPVSMIGASDCALFMWCTWPTIFMAEKVAKAWGFRYSGLAWEWIKRNPKTGKYAFGTGYGTRKNVEPCLLFLRGAPKMNDSTAARSVRDWIMAPRREHSRKPEEARKRIEIMYPGPYLELFARAPVENWDVFGNQVTKFMEAAAE